MIAVAGGFSAGKSAFISSFLEKIHLPSNATPTTSIPIYLIHHEENTSFIVGKMRDGTNKYLSTLCIESILEKLSHYTSDADEELKELKKSLLHLYLYTPFKAHYKPFCFIDTPGYNPAERTNDFTQKDYENAINFSLEADMLLWLIGLDVNGTISSSDIAFLSKIQQQVPDMPIYIVLNKADLRTLNDINHIIDVIWETLEDYEIQVKGISAYSAVNQQEVAYKEITLDQFLESDAYSRLNKAKILKKRLNKCLDKLKYSPFFDIYDQKSKVESEFNAMRKKLECCISNVLGILDK